MEVLNVTDKILRSGVPHAVETSLVTRNAINPKHAFLEVDPSKERALVDFDKSDAESPSSSQTDPVAKSVPENLNAGGTGPLLQTALKTRETLSTSKAHIRDNIQALDKLAQSDNWQSLGLEKTQDNHQLVESTQRIQKEIHRIRKKKSIENWQTKPDDTVADNFQSLGQSQHIQETKLYLEKKSIKDNRQKAPEIKLNRAMPDLSTAGQTPQPSNPAHSQVTTDSSDKKSLSRGERNAFEAESVEEDALQMRMKKIKASVRDVNDTLSDFNPKT